MGAHLRLIDGKTQWQSDKYPTTPAGKVPLSVNDVTGQDLLWLYAQRRRSVDAEFSDDLETALRSAGFVPHVSNVIEIAAKLELAQRVADLERELALRDLDDLERGR